LSNNRKNFTRTQTTTQAANTQTVKAFAESAVLFDKNTEAILRKHIHMPEEKWALFNHNDLCGSGFKIRKGRRGVDVKIHSPKLPP